MSATPEPSHSLFAELKRHNVVRVAALYLIAAWLIMQVADVLFGMIGVPPWSGKLLAFLALGFMASQDVSMGRFADGAALLRQAIDRDPLRAVLHYDLSFALIALSQYAEGEKAASRGLQPFRSPRSTRTAMTPTRSSSGSSGRTGSAMQASRGS